MRWWAVAVLLAVEAMAKPVPEQIPISGAPIDLTGWTYRAKIGIRDDGVQQLDLDLETLARAARDLRDVRVVSDGQQFPYLLETSADTHRYVPLVETVTDPKRPTTSLWKIRLPAAGAPITRLICQTRAPLFDRSVAMRESDQRTLGTARWVRTPAQASRPLELIVSALPAGNEIFLEMENGDNPAIALDDFELEYPVVRLLFRASMSPETFLYFGNPEAVAPSYDVALIAPQLRAAARQSATLGTGERVRAVTLSEKLQRPGGRRWILWVGLGIVVVALLAVIARLLPKQ